MDAATTEALDALNVVGARLKAAKAAGDDITAILAEYNTAKGALEAIVRPQAEAAARALPAAQPRRRQRLLARERALRERGLAGRRGARASARVRRSLAPAAQRGG